MTQESSQRHPFPRALFELFHPQHVDGEQAQGTAYWVRSLTKDKKDLRGWDQHRDDVAPPLAPNGLWLTLGRYRDSGREDQDVLEFSALFVDADVKPGGNNHDGCKAAIAQLPFDLPNLMWKTSGSGGVQAAWRLSRIVSGPEMDLVVEAWREATYEYLARTPNGPQLDPAIYTKARCLRAWSDELELLRSNPNSVIDVDELLERWSPGLKEHKVAATDARSGHRPEGSDNGAVDYLNFHGKGWIQRALAEAGWKIVGSERHRQRLGLKFEDWRHPNATSRISASISTSADDGYQRIKVFTSNADRIEEGSHSIYYALCQLQGKEVTDRAIRSSPDYKRWAEAHRPSRVEVSPDSGSSADPDAWEPEDLDALWDTPPRRPDVGEIVEGCLFYRGTVNTLFGHSTSGKSWIALQVCIQEIRKGRHVLWLDYEDTPSTLTMRLRQLGLEREELKLVRYVRPGEAALPDDDVFERLSDNCSVVVVDSTGEAAALDRGVTSTNDQDQMAVWFARFARYWARANAAVILIDHLASAADQTTRKPIGSVRKLAAVDGAMYRVDIRESFSKKKAGRSTLICTKDRHGSYAVGEPVADTAYTPRLDEQSSLEIAFHVPTVEIDDEEAVAEARRKEREMKRWEKTWCSIAKVLHDAGAEGETEARLLRHVAERPIWVKRLEVAYEEGLLEISRGQRGRKYVATHSLANWLDEPPAWLFNPVDLDAVISDDME